MIIIKLVPKTKPVFLILLLCLLFLLPLASTALAEQKAAQKIKVMALFTDKAMIFVDGSQKLISKGQAFNGIKLISADSDFAVLEVQGARVRYPLGSEINTTFKKQDPGKTLVIWKDRDNMFRYQGKINNASVHFLIDTGATSIALNSGTARQAGINYKKGSQKVVQTASGLVKAWQVSLNKVTIGHIHLYNVNAMVLEGSFPTYVLLGQSFLSRIHMIRDGDKMNLRKKF